MSSILLVHPHAGTREAVGSILENHGHRCLSARNGPEALEAFRRDRADIVILNRDLPAMTSTQVFTEIQRIDSKTKVLIFAVQGVFEPPETPARFGIRSFRPGEVLQIVEELAEGAQRAKSESERFASRVLVVDDDPGVLAALRRFLTDKGYEVGVAHDGSEALPLLKKLRPHLVLLDVDMPQMNGIETLKRIREIDGQVGVMMITGDDALDTLALCRDYGAYDYLIKPFDFQYLAFSVYSKIVLMTLLP